MNKYKKKKLFSRINVIYYNKYNYLKNEFGKRKGLLV